MDQTIEDMIFLMVEAYDYYKGFGAYEEHQCIFMQLYAQVLYW